MGMAAVEAGGAWLHDLERLGARPLGETMIQALGDAAGKSELGRTRDFASMASVARGFSRNGGNTKLWVGSKGSLWTECPGGERATIGYTRTVRGAKSWTKERR